LIRKSQIYFDSNTLGIESRKVMLQVHKEALQKAMGKFQNDEDIGAQQTKGCALQE
jgi:hypothetical protein